MASSPIRQDQAVLNVSYNSTNVSQQCSVYDAQIQNSIGSWGIGDLRLLVSGVTTSNYPVVIVYDSKNYPYTIPAGGTSYTVTLDEITPFAAYRDKININGVEAELHDSRISAIDATPTSGSTNLVTSGGVYSGLSGKADSSSVHSIPSGGSAGQVLSKIDGTDYNAEWTTPQGGDTNAVLYTAQTLTTAQQTQARENIDALGGDDVETVTELGIDSVVTQNSNNLITSGAVYSVVGDIETLLAAI